MELVAVLRPEAIESKDGLYDIVVADFFQKGPERRDDWIAHISGVEIPVPRRATDDEMLAAVHAQTLAFERSANAPVAPPEDTRTRRALVGALVGFDLEPPRR